MRNTDTESTSTPSAVEAQPMASQSVQDDEDTDRDLPPTVAVAPPQKRRRKGTGKSFGSTNKKHVRGRQGGLKDFMTLPIDVFTQIVNLLAPEDLLILSRANKFFRNLLIRRSATHIWRKSLENIPGLPPCPPDMSEPQYAAVVFVKQCTFCGISARRRMDTLLRVRVCPACAETCIVGFRAVPWEARSLIVRSTTNGTTGRSNLRHERYLRKDVDFVLEKLAEFKSSGDKNALDDWKTERGKYLESRKEHSKALDDYFDSAGNSRGEELHQLKTQRRQEIESRLAALGWSDEQDLEFPWYTDSKRAWTAIVEQPKPLTDRIWDNIQAKLISLLEANRERRLREEKEERQEDRRRRIYQLLEGFKKATPPMAKMLLSSRIDPLSTDDPFVIKHIQNDSSVQLATPFPKFADACQWEALRDLVQDEIPIDEMEILFNQRQDQIQLEISQWRDRVEEHFVGLVREEYPGIEIPKPQIIQDSVDESLEKVSDSAAMLLRADSLFCATGASATVPYSYGSLMAMHRSGRNYEVGLAWVPSMFKLHSEASSIARSLLRDLARPDASFLEFKRINRFMCGRCTDFQLRSWEGMVRHYLGEQDDWAEMQKNIPKFVELDIAYNYIHDLSLDDKPLVKLLTPEEASSIQATSKSIPAECQCIMCERAGVKHMDPKDCMIAHVTNVHGIVEPKALNHFKFKTYVHMETRPIRRRGYGFIGSYGDW